MAAVYPAPPPTSNTLDPLQRKRLLKSTQKLGALLGTTPRVLEPGSTLPPPLTPGTRAFRREGKVFHNPSASSSTTTLSSVDTESFVWVPSPTEMLKHHHHKNASTPIAIEFPLSASEKAMSPTAGHKKSKSSQQHGMITAPQQLSQPLLYRLRSLPIPPPLVVTPPPALDKITPLSPLSPTFDATVIKPRATVRRKDSRKALSESDRRRKMAKLTRTLGENIPPELVFGPPRSSSLVGNSMTTITPTPGIPPPLCKRRNRATTGVHPSTPSPSSSKSKSKSPKVDVVPPVPTTKTSISSGVNHISAVASASPSKRVLPTAAAVTPVVTVTTTVVTTGITTTTTTTTSTECAKNTGRKQRPRSLTLAHIPIGLHKGILVEQQHPQGVEEPGREHSRSLDETERVASKRCKGTNPAAAASTTDLVDYGRRKEREWSGEWNVKDMEDVVKALRGLRIR